jgi:hypothetical protein
MVEGSEKTTAQYSTISGNLSLASLEVVECLIDNSAPSNQGSTSTTFIELLTFQRKPATNNAAFSNKTDFEMRFNYTEKAVRHGQMTKYSHPRTEFE